MRVLLRSLIVVALVASAGHCRAQHVPKLSVQNHKSEIEKLLELSPENASKRPKTDVDTRTIAVKCAEQLEKARSYGSIALILDRGDKELTAHDFIGISWSIDHVEPDRYHVVQNSWGGGPGYDFDEWITIANSQFDFTGFWMQGLDISPPNWDPLQQNRELGLQKYLQILRREQPSSADMYSYDGKNYYSLLYLLPADHYEAFPLVPKGPANLRMWIDSESGLLAHAHLFQATSPSGVTSPEFVQVFVAYSGDVHIEPPREKCSESRSRMCFASRTPQSETTPGNLPEASAHARTEATAPLRVYTHPTYRWSVSYPSEWKIDATNPDSVRITSPSGDGLCGLHSGIVRFKTVDEFTEFMQGYSERSFADRGVTERSSPKRRISLPNDVLGIDVLTDILSGGRSRRIYVLADGIGYSIDCETYASNWEELSSPFARIISSFTLEKKPRADLPPAWTHPTYHWSVSYPPDWEIDPTDPDEVRIVSPSEDGLCGLHSGVVQFKTVDEFADSIEVDRKRYFTRKGASLQSSPKQRISLPSDVIGVEVLTGVPSGGRSRRVYILAGGVGYIIDCESAENWEKLQPFFTRIISSFTLERKP